MPKAPASLRSLPVRKLAGSGRRIVRPQKESIMNTSTERSTATQPITPPERPEEAREWFHNRRRGMIARRPHMALVVVRKEGGR